MIAAMYDVRICAIDRLGWHAIREPTAAAASARLTCPEEEEEEAEKEGQNVRTICRIRAPGRHRQQANALTRAVRKGSSRNSNQLEHGAAQMNE